MNEANKRLNWNNLKRNRCPKCGKELAWHMGVEPINTTYECLCGFRISERKYRKIVSGIVESEIEKEVEEDVEN